MRTPLYLALVLLLSACASSTAQAERPAVIVNPMAATRAELLNIVRMALNNAPVTLADDALTQDNALIIERTPRHDAGGQLLNGRVLELPEHFVLSLSNSHCVLTQQSTHRHWVLRQATCVAR
jgi:hypothetical protein